MKATRLQIRALIRESLKSERIDESLFGFLGGMFGSGKKPYSTMTLKDLNKLWREWHVILNTPTGQINILGTATGDAVADKRQWLAQNIGDDAVEIRDFMKRYRIWLSSPDFQEFKKTATYARLRHSQSQEVQRFMKESASIKEIKMSEIQKSVRKCLEKEGGAAGMGLLVKCVKSLQTKTKKLPKHCRTNKQIAKCILKMNFVVKHRYDDIILTVGLPKRKQ
jgi:hypothetical protein